MGGPWRDIQGSEWRLRRICHPAGVGRGRLLVALSTAHAQAAPEKGWPGSRSTLIEMDEKRALSNQLEGLDETAQGETEASGTRRQHSSRQCSPFPPHITSPFFPFEK